MIEEAIALYRKCTPIIRNARVSRSGPVVRSYAKPEGYQKNLRGYHISSMFADNATSASLGEDGYLQIEAMHAFDGAVFHCLRAE